MNALSWIVWGFASTIVLTTIMAASQALGWTRMSIPYLLGTIVTPDRDRAHVLGVFLHIVNGWVFSLIYVAAFEVWPLAWPQWLSGAAIGLVHAAFVLAVAMPVLPGMHPRMASPTAGPRARDSQRWLEPPGALALNYGLRTPIAIVIAHIVFGVILGAFYRLA